MKNKRLLLVVLIGVVGAVLVASGSWGYGVRGQIPDTPDSMQVQETIQLSYEIEAQVAHTFDDSLYPTIYVNDSRGGKITGTNLNLIQSMRNDYSLTEDSVGFLDYKVAYNAWREKGALLVEQVWAKAKSEGRDYLTEDEAKSLMDPSGRVAQPRLPPSVKFTTNLTFISISIDGEVAKAVFDDGAQTQEMLLVKIDGKWYIAGLKILSSHP